MNSWALLVDVTLEVNYRVVIEIYRWNYYDNVLILLVGYCQDAASIDVASHRGGNPSIGEASLSLGSGSQLEKLGRENDRESASNVALAGTSLAGSIASSVLPGGQRLEVQADVTSAQRFSLCSETASAATSISEKSVNASIALDDGAASTRALAGSVLNYKVFSLQSLFTVWGSKFRLAKIHKC